MATAMKQFVDRLVAMWGKITPALKAIIAMFTAPVAFAA
jgi:hypothetical protein